MTTLLQYHDRALVESYLAGWRRLLHPLAVASTITSDERGQPQPVERYVAGDSLVVAKMGDSFVALDNHCRHRGAKLSQGWVNLRDRTFVCPYHGFEWALDGELAKIPAYHVEGLACPRSKRWQTRPHQVIERYGVLWACPAGEPIVPLPHIPALDDPSLLGGVFVEEVIRTGAGRSVEGTLDTYHIAFAHRASIGNPDMPEAPRTEVRQEGQFLYMEFTVDQEQNPSAKGGEDADARVPVLYQQWASPNVVFILKSSPAGRYGLLFLYRVVSAHETVVYRQIFRDYDTAATEDEFLALEDQIDHEDRHLLEQIHPAIIPADPNFEVHTIFDKPTLSYRQYMKSLGFEYF